MNAMSLLLRPSLLGLPLNRMTYGRPDWPLKKNDALLRTPLPSGTGRTAARLTRCPPSLFDLVSGGLFTSMPIGLFAQFEPAVLAVPSLMDVAELYRYDPLALKPFL